MSTDQSSRTMRTTFSLWLLTIAFCFGALAAPLPSGQVASAFQPVIDVGQPEEMTDALKSANNDASKAVGLLRTAAETGDGLAQLSIALIMQRWLKGQLSGHPDEPFTWRESWTWYHLAAFHHFSVARNLSIHYRQGAPGLPKNEKLAECLYWVGDKTTKENVGKCLAMHPK